MSLHPSIATLLTCYDDLEALIGDLSADEWEVQSLCPDWSVRGVVTHLAAVEHLLDGWMPEGDETVPPFGDIGPNTERLDSLTVEALVDDVRSVLARRRQQMSGLSDDDLAHPAMTPVGPATYGRFLDIRAFDFWVHQWDMAHPLGRPTDDAGPGAVRSVDEVEASIGYIVGKKIALPDGLGVAFELTGPVQRSILAKVDGRAARVDELADPDVTVTTDSTTFVQLACGRIDPQAPIDDGRISWSGDAHWGETAARNLAFTM